MNVRQLLRPLLPRTFTVHRIKRGPLAGRRIVTSWHDYPAAILGYAEVSLINWLLENVKEGETWIDVGAHYGFTTIALCEKVAKYGRVFAFEPSLPTVGCIVRTKAINQYEQLVAVPFALTNDMQIGRRCC